MGICADFTEIAWNAANVRIAFVNPLMPAMPRGPRIDLDEADFVVEAESPLIQVPPVAADPTGQAIAEQVSSLIPDSAALQIGIGSAPAALWRALGSRRHLRLRSGLASEELLYLAEEGALAEHGHVAGILAGTSQFYSTMAERDLVRLANAGYTHDFCAIGKEANFFSVNSALAVDLFGQVNLEWQGSHPLSGVGGAPDFAAAALASAGGCGITMLPASARKGTISRIVAHLESPTVSLPRNLSDVIATEYGVAHLRGKSMDERAEALIAIADPAFREDLVRDWRQLRVSMSG